MTVKCYSNPKFNLVLLKTNAWCKLELVVLFWINNSDGKEQNLASG